MFVTQLLEVTTDLVESSTRFAITSRTDHGVDQMVGRAEQSLATSLPP